MSTHFAHHPVSVGLLLFPTVQEIRCRGGLRVLPDHLLEECPRLDLLVVPGGPNAREQYNDERIAAFLRRQREQTPIIASGRDRDLLYFENTDKNCL